MAPIIELLQDNCYEALITDIFWDSDISDSEDLLNNSRPRLLEKRDHVEQMNKIFNAAKEASSDPASVRITYEVKEPETICRSIILQQEMFVLVC